MEEKRVKRIKDKDNPYTLHIVDNGYRVDFVDVLKVKRQVDIDEKISIIARVHVIMEADSGEPMI